MHSNFRIPAVEEKLLAFGRAITVRQLDDISNDWLAAYRLQSGRITDMRENPSGTIRFIFDCAGSDHCDGRGPQPPGVVPRTVVASGFSAPTERSRDKEDNRLKGWMGTTGRTLGKDWDKGHFVAHSVGGGVEGVEDNVFQHRCDLNRGWSEEGKVFRKMESCCVANPGTPFWHRPIYLRETDIPAFLEFGLVQTDGSVWAEIFDNRVGDAAR
jgi:hypothetical protein